MSGVADRLKNLSNSIHSNKTSFSETRNNMTEYKFFGWVGKDKNSIGNLVWEEYEPKTWTEDDVDIKISIPPSVFSLVDGRRLMVAHCGICSSDLHTLRSGWGPTNYPAVVGHEIVGKAVKVGKNVKGIKLGDRVGVGAQSGSCLECGHCQESTLLCPVKSNFRSRAIL
jgi:threonine dehydrogenase-like Zn-dependent dehydrogenase